MLFPALVLEETSVENYKAKIPGDFWFLFSPHFYCLDSALFFCMTDIQSKIHYGAWACISRRAYFEIQNSKHLREHVFCVWKFNWEGFSSQMNYTGIATISSIATYCWGRALSSSSSEHSDGFYLLQSWQNEWGHCSTILAFRRFKWSWCLYILMLNTS